jgi:hypothetical protein
MGRTCGAGKIIYFINLRIIGECNIMSDKFKIRVTYEVFDVPFLSRKKFVQTNNIIMFFNESVAEMTSQKPGSACYQRSGIE